jgi:hypothetical protein
MSLRRFLARAQAAVLSGLEWLTTVEFSKEGEGHWRRMSAHAEQQFELAAIKELSPVEAADVQALTEDLVVIRTGEFPIVVAEVVEEFKPGIYVHDEPIGPKLPTVDEQFAAFEADPLGAELPGAPAKDNAWFAETLAEVELPAPLVEDLEKTGSWSRGYLAALARGER